jgi:hypothetical protein
VKTVLDIADHGGEIEELEISELLELSAPLSSHGTEMPEEDGTYDQLIEGLPQRPANGAQSLLTPETPQESRSRNVVSGFSYRLFREFLM